MWGKRPCQNCIRHVCKRFIPTHVGKTQVIFVDDLGIRGSSPRMWGKHPSSHHQPDCRRFIPTHVGKTADAPTPVIIDCGSSPRMWGKRFAGTFPAGSGPVHPHACGENVNNAGLSICKIRFIPTHVGKTRRWCVFLRRVRRFIPTHVGKTTARGLVAHHATRFIPTHVGKTCSATNSRSSRCGSSPRMWGKRIRWTTFFPKLRGSSPRMWGKRQLTRWYRYPPRRFIPTHVGKTLTIQEAGVPVIGSSPRMWGKHLQP